MTTRYYGKIYKKKDVSRVKVIVFGVIYGVVGCVLGYLIPNVMDEELVKCHSVSVLLFGVLGLLVGVFQTLFDVPYNKINMIIVTILFVGYLSLRYVFCK